MEQQKTHPACACRPSPARVRELCPACLLAWAEFREEDERNFRMAAAYGAAFDRVLAKVVGA